MVNTIHGNYIYPCIRKTKEIIKNVKKRLTLLVNLGIILIADFGWQLWGISSAGRASRLHREGQRFDPAMLHHLEINRLFGFFLISKKKTNLSF